MAPGQVKKKTEKAGDRTAPVAMAAARTAREAREQYPVGLSDEERAIIEAAAHATGLDRSAFCRTESVQAARRKLVELGIPIPGSKA